jgi:hypothetical protein
MWQLGKLLSINANVKHIERIFMIKVRYIWNFTGDDLVFVGTFSTEPV